MRENLNNDGQAFDDTLSQEIGEQPQKDLHYSQKGGHGQRHNFLQELKSLNPNKKAVPTELAWHIRRKMHRDPQSGRR